MCSFAENDPVAFLNQHAEGIVLDEVRDALSLLSHIQGMLDDGTKRLFIFSDSSQLAMLKWGTQSLTERIAVFELRSMSYFEFRNMTVDMSLDGSILPLIQGATCLNSFIRHA